MALFGVLAINVVMEFRRSGLFGHANVTTALAIGVYIAQAMISALWLRHYRFGPVEWLWRSLMYGSRQPLRQH
jgi:uncharacterized protein